MAEILDIPPDGYMQGVQRWSDPNNADTGTFQNVGRFYGDNANVNAYTVEQEQIRLANLRTEQERIAAQEQAIKLRGQMNYQRDIQAGIPPQEAFQRNLGDLLFAHPERMATALKATAPELAFEPQVIGQPNGSELVQLGPNRWQYVKPKPAAMPQSNKDERTMLLDQIKSARGGILYNPATDEPKLKPLTDKFMELGTNWQGAPATASLPPELTAKPSAKSESGPATPKTKAEVEALPKGAPFVNPADGKIYYKK